MIPEACLRVILDGDLLLWYDMSMSLFNFLQVSELQTYNYIINSIYLVGKTVVIIWSTAWTYPIKWIYRPYEN